MGGKISNVKEFWPMVSDKRKGEAVKKVWGDVDPEVIKKAMKVSPQETIKKVKEAHGIDA